MNLTSIRMLKSFILLMLLAACNADSSASSTASGQKEIYNSHLDLALDMIVRAKYALPKVPEDFIPKPLDCAEILQMGVNMSGIYEISPKNRVTESKGALTVYCDMDTDGGGWTVIQRRGDFHRHDDYFYKDWKSYKEGFGDIDKDFWLGNDNIFALTNQKLYSVRFDLKDKEQNEAYAIYDKFWIDDEDHNYTLHIFDYRGNAGDSMTYHNHQAFSTKDRENDVYPERNCAVYYTGAWWYKTCLFANLNGLYVKGPKVISPDRISWHGWKKAFESLAWTEIKIRPKMSFPSDVSPV